MKLRFAVLFSVVFAALHAMPAWAVTPIDAITQRALDDAKVIRRVSEVAGKDIPRELLQRIISEDVDLLRGLRSDGTYEYAHYEPTESTRIKEGLKVSQDTLSNGSIKGEFVYQLIVEAPSRRYVVRRNPAVFVEKIEIDRTPLEGSSEIETIDVQSWIEPGQSRSFDLKGVMRRARATVYAKTGEGMKTASLEIALVRGSVVDDRDSPFLTAVREALRIQQLLRKSDAASIGSAASSMIHSLGEPATSTRTVQREPAARPSWEARESRDDARASEASTVMDDSQLHAELLAIEDLMTGNDAEQRDGLRRLHQLVRRTRPAGEP